MQRYGRDVPRQASCPRRNLGIRVKAALAGLIAPVIVLVIEVFLATGCSSHFGELAALGDRDRRRRDHHLACAGAFRSVDDDAIRFHLSASSFGAGSSPSRVAICR